MRSKGLYRVTMGTEVEPNSVVEKTKYFNGLDEAYGFLCLSISREFSPLPQAEMEANHILLTPFNLFEWKVEMVIQLRYKGLYIVTMGIEVEPNSAVEKAKYFNRLDEAYGLLCPSISRELLFHINSLTTPDEVRFKLESLFGKTDELREHQLENELTILSPTHFETI